MLRDRRGHDGTRGGRSHHRQRVGLTLLRRERARCGGETDDSAKGLQASASALEKNTGRRCLPAPADVRDPKALQGAVERAKEVFGRVDYVICGAAGNLCVSPRFPTG